MLHAGNIGGPWDRSIYYALGYMCLGVNIGLVPLLCSYDGTVIVWDQRMARELWWSHER